MDNAQVEAVARALAECEIRKNRRQDTSEAEIEAMIAKGVVDYSWGYWTGPATAAIAAIGPSEYERGATEERAKIVAWLRGLHWTHAGKLEADRFATAISNMEPGK